MSYFFDNWRAGGRGQGGYTLASRNASEVPLILQMSASQTANGLEIKNVSGTTVFSVSPVGNVSYTGSETITDALTVSGNTSIGGTLSVTGTATLNNGLILGAPSISGAANFINDVVANHNLTVNNNLIANGYVYFNSVVNFSGNVILGDSASDTVTIYGYLQGHTSGKTFVAIGNVTTAHSLNATNDFAVGGELEVQGASFFDGIVEIDNFIHAGSTNTNWRTDFPFAQLVASQADTGQTDPNNIGVLGEATGSGGRAGIGLRGFGRSNGADQGQGFQGIAVVSNATDTGIAYGGVVQSNSVHTGADNVGLYVSATNASGSGENIAFQIASGLFKDNNLYRQHASQSLADDAQVVIKTGTAGYGFAQIGNNQEWVHFTWATNGVVTLTNNSANVVNTDTDTKFCIYDAGAGIAIKNRLGSALTLRYAINYS